jgi:hypothetical protein
VTGEEIKAARLALVERIKTIDFEFTQVSPYKLNNPTVPCAYLMLLDEVWPDGTHVRNETLTFTVNVLIATTSDVAAQETLDEFVGSTGDRSIKAALEQVDPGEQTVTLGGLIADLEVIRCRPDRLFATPRSNDPHATALGGEWTVLVYPKP